MEVDYLIVGFGIAGMSLAFQLQSEGKSILIIDGKEEKASIVAAGLYNPIVLRRFTLAWDAEKQMEYAKFFYADLSVFLNKNTTQNLPVYRKFNSPEEQNNWFQGIDKPLMGKYLSPYLKDSPSEFVDGDYKFGEVKHTGRVLIASIYETYRDKLLEQNKFLKEEFDFNKLKINDDHIVYNSIKAKRIVFCEGHKLKENPYFNYLPLIGNKGSYIIFKCPNLKLKVALKSYYFIIPLGNDLYKFGATYEYHFKNTNHDKSTRTELINRLEELIKSPFEVVNQVTGVRPTVKDRRPLLGNHLKYKPLYVMNGMGTRGVLLAPLCSFYLKNFMEKGEALPEEMNIKRFDSFL